MASQTVSFTNPNSAGCNPWMESGLDSPLGPYPSQIKDDEVTKHDLKMFLPLANYKYFCKNWPKRPGMLLIEYALEAFKTFPGAGFSTKDRDSYKWLKFGTPFLLKIELFARALFTIYTGTNIRPCYKDRDFFRIDHKNRSFLSLKRIHFLSVIMFLENRVRKLEAKQKGSKVAQNLSKAASAMKLSLPRKKAYHWERYAGEENKSIPLADQIKRLRAVILTFHACYCTDHKKVYMKDAVRLVKAVVHLKEIKYDRFTREAKLQKNKAEGTSLKKAFNLSPALEKMSLEELEDVALDHIYSAVIKILEFIRSDTRPIAQEQTADLMDMVYLKHFYQREKSVKLEDLKIGEANILKYAHCKTILLIDPIKYIPWDKSEPLDYDGWSLAEDRYEVAQLLIEKRGYVFRAESSVPPPQIEGATAPSKEEVYEGSSTGNGSLPPSPPSHTGYGMGAGMGAGAVDNVPPPEVPSQHYPGSRTPFPTAPSPEPTAPIEEIDIFDKGESQQETEPAKVLVNGKWIEV